MLVIAFLSSKSVLEWTFHIWQKNDMSHQFYYFPLNIFFIIYQP